MKKIVTLLMLFFIGSAVRAEFPINVGVHGGVSSTKIKVKDIPWALKAKSNSGYMIGAFFRFNLGQLYIEPSLNYSHKKGRIDTKRGNDDIKINSMDIPIMVGFNVLDFSIVTLRTYVGPVVSFTGKVKQDILSEVDNDHVMWNGKIGVGVDIWKITFDIDYEKSFKKFGHELKAPRSFNFTLGLKII